VVERGGAALVQYLAVVAGVDALGQAGLSDYVWEVAGSEVSVSV
jgi:hypothetical protein